MVMLIQPVATMVMLIQPVATMVMLIQPVAAMVMLIQTVACGNYVNMAFMVRLPFKALVHFGAQSQDYNTMQHVTSRCHVACCASCYICALIGGKAVMGN